MWGEMTASEYQEYIKTGKLPGEDTPRKSKYNAKRTNGYASKREADRAAELQLMVRAGEIALVLEQVPFPLPGGIKYVADFVRLNMDGTWTVEDAKGVRTDVYKLKAKLFFEQYGREIMEV